MPRALVAMVSGLVLLVGLSAGAGYFAGQYFSPVAETGHFNELESMLAQDRAELLEEKAQLQAHIDALSIRMGSLQAQMLRLDALGDRLVDVAKLDSSEFNFSEEPPIGGRDIPESTRSTEIDELIADVGAFNQLIDDRVLKMDLLEELLATGQLYEEITPSGRPVMKGWLSSRFGKRIDPKTGKKTFHRGYDYAGKPGADVISVAAGFVVRSEYQGGFGNMIEIKHTDGYSTLYAHNKKNLVKAGDVVKKGQKIALLGSTGRSTGPHVHFEVRRDGKYVNPKKFVRR